ncbi:transposase [Clostridium beijerinckii]|uniref:transposase n=1 Tax=Clostridium beijerinckii TaxID=1520 RepID=UPI0009912656|nr:transposase [Clostridium beijerinckii]
MIIFITGKCTGISFIDSTTVDVFQDRKIHSHKVFTGIAERVKNSTGWFYVFKLHRVVNDKGDIISFYSTQGNVDDREAKTIEALFSKGSIWQIFSRQRIFISKDLRYTIF